MNDDDFETKLHAATSVSRRPDPTAAWKADILARARREADATAKARLLPPRWLMLGWAAAWVAVIGLNLTSPKAEPQVALSPPIDSKPTPAPTLLAYHKNLNLSLDLIR